MKVDKLSDFETEHLSFHELDQGFTIKEAIAEARRCLQCKKPSCEKGCPIEHEIVKFINEIANGNMGEAGAIIARRSNLPAVCGRVCPHELQCEGACVMQRTNKPIQVGKLERFVADFDAEMDIITTEKLNLYEGKVAVIGSGPAGLTVAGDLAKLGIDVTVFESQPEPGGILMYGIPRFRLNREVVRREIAKIAKLGVEFRTKVVVGEDITIDDLLVKEKYDAVFIGTGTALPKPLELPGRDNTGILQAMYLLRMATLHEHGDVAREEVPIDEGDTIVVIGAGNVAFDAARTALRLGAKKVTIVYRKTKKEMPALQTEFEYAEREGVDFCWLSSPCEFQGKAGNVSGLTCEKLTTDKDDKIIKTKQKITIPANKIILAIGQRPAARIINTAKGIEVNSEGYVITRDYPYGMSTLKGVFAGGDVVHQPATVVLAMKEAKKVAAGVLKYVEAKKLMEKLG